MATNYVLRNLDSDLSGGADFNKQLVVGTETQNSIEIPVVKGDTDVSYGFTNAGIPGTSGMTGDYTVEVYIVTGNAEWQVYCSIDRVNSSGVPQNLGTESAAQYCTAGLHTFNFTAQNRGTWQSGDRLRVRFFFYNPTHSTSSIYIRTGTTDCEVVAPWDSGLNLVKDSSRTEGISEALARKLTMNRAASSTEGIAESLARTLDYIRANSESIDVSEVAEKVLAIVREDSDSVSIAETLARIRGLARAISDGVGIAEAIATTKTLIRSKADPVSIAEAVSRVLDYVRSIETTIGIGESIARSMNLARNVPDDVSIADVADRLLSMRRSLSESIGIGETTVTARGFVRSVDSVEGISESIARLRSAVRSIADPTAIAESVAISRALARVDASVVGISESIIRFRALVRSISSTIGVGETVSKYLSGGGADLVRAVSSSLSIAEVLAIMLGIVQSNDDAIAIDESTSRVRGMNRPVNDPIGISESVEPALFAQIVQTIDESIAVAEVSDLCGDCLIGVEIDQANLADIDLLKRASKPIKPPTGRVRLYAFEVGGKLQVRAIYPSGYEDVISEDLS